MKPHSLPNKSQKLLSAAFAVFISLSFLAPVFADNAKEQLSVNIHTQKYVLDNGLTVLLSDMPSSSSIAVYALVKTGGAMEGRFLGAGISHFMEHMLFKGTDKRAVGAISREVQAMGGTINATTSFDYTIFVIDVPEGNFDHALDIISDMVMHSKFDPEQIKKEREVVYGEMRLYRDQPERLLSEEVFRIAYVQHPYRVPVIGYEELLRPLTREDFVEYYKERYVPNNIVLSIAGKVNPQETLEKVKAIFKDFPRQREVARIVSQEPPQVTGREYEFHYPTELTRISMDYSGVSVSNPDMFALDVLSLILGQGDSSRLYQDLFEKHQLVRSVGVSNFTPIDRGLFEIECAVDDKNREVVIQAIKEHVQKIITKGVQPTEVEKAKRQVLSHYIFDRQTPADIAYNSAIDEAFLGDNKFSEKYVQQVSKVTAQDIQRVAEKYLIDTNLSVVILRPGEKESGKEAPLSAAVEAPIQKIVLQNGLKILLREDKTLPIVSVAVAVNGGTLEETPQVNGISLLTSNLWVKGSQALSGNKLSEALDARGISLNGFSGRNSFGFTISALSSELDFTLNLMEGLINKPAFAPDDLERERLQLQTGLINKNDNIAQLSTFELKQTLFKNHPFRLDELGTVDSISHLTRQDVTAFYSRLAKPDNMVLSIFGNIDAAKLTKDLTTRFSTTGTPSPPPLTKHQAEPVSQTTREKTLRLNKEQAMVVVGFQGPDMYSPDRYGVEVMSAVLGSPFSGRIFTQVRDEFGKAYTLGGTYVPARDAGMIYFYVQTTAENAAKVKQLLLAIIEKIQSQPISEQELADMKSYLKGALHMGMQTNAEMAFVTTLDELYGLGYQRYQDYGKQIDRITAADVQRLAQKYLRIQNATLIMTLPADKKVALPVQP